MFLPCAKNLSYVFMCRLCKALFFGKKEHEDVCAKNGNNCGIIVLLFIFHLVGKILFQHLLRFLSHLVGIIGTRVLYQQLLRFISHLVGKILFQHLLRSVAEPVHF